MRTFQSWYGLAVLVMVSVAGEQACSRLASNADQSAFLTAAGKAIDRLPEVIGPWRVVQSYPLDDSAVEMLQCPAYKSQVYAHDQTGEQVSLILLTGPAGPLLAHTPEICYSSTGFDLLEPARPQVVRRVADDRSDTFDKVLFLSKALNGERHRVYYAWRTATSPWLAPENPRLTLGGMPMLYKLQLAANIGRPAADGFLGNPEAEADPVERFLSELLPVLDRILRFG